MQRPRAVAPLPQRAAGRRAELRGGPRAVRREALEDAHRRRVQDHAPASRV